MYLDLVGRDTFWRLLALFRGRLFRDTDFSAIYCPGDGRANAASRLLPTVLLLQTHDKVSDGDTKVDFDIWSRAIVGGHDGGRHLLPNWMLA